MSIRSRDHLSDAALVRQAIDHTAREFQLTGEQLAAIDVRQAYRAEAYSSLLDFRVRGLRLTDDEARFRIRIARIGRRFPALFDAIAEGRLRPTAVVLLAPRLTDENAAELIAAATHHTKEELCEMLAARFPKPDVPDRIEPLLPEAAVSDVQEMSSEVVLEPPLKMECEDPDGRSLETFTLSAPPAGALGPRARIEALSPDSFAVHGTIRRRTYERMEYVKSLLGRAIKRDDLDELLFGAFDAWARELERTKYGITDRPRARSSRRSRNPRHIPAELKRAVVKRDGGRCTFVSDSGRRCEERSGLEFDHEVPVARGGEATAANLRLRCRAHNQFEAERIYGAEFMRHKREAAREAAVRRRREREVRAKAAADAQSRAGVEREKAEAAARARQHAVEEVIPVLRTLGFRKDEARAAAARCEAIPDASLEERVRLALKCFATPGRGVVAGSAVHASSPA